MMVVERYGWQPGEVRVVGQDAAASTEVPQEHHRITRPPIPAAMATRAWAAQSELAAAGGAKTDKFAMPDDLADHWVHGEGAAKVRWCAEGGFERGRRALREYVPAHMLDGTVANLYKRACGKWPGQHRD
jgi:hypothetical protein